MAAIVLYLASSLIALAITAFVFARNPAGRPNRLHFLYTFFSTLWFSGVLLPETPHDLLLIHFRLLYPFALVTSVSLYFFISSISNARQSAGKSTMILFTSAVMIAISLFTPLATSGVTRSADGIVTPERGALYVLVIAWIIFIGVATIFTLSRQSRKARGALRQQLQVVSFGYFGAFLFALLTTVVLSNVVGTSEVNNYAPLSSIALSGFLGYSIVRQGFLDIRLLVVRAISYALLLALITVLFSLFLFFVFQKAFGVELQIEEQGVLLFVVLALTYSMGRIETWLRKVSTDFFYRGYYKVDRVIDRLSTLATSEYDIDRLSMGALAIFKETLKPSSASFVLLDSQGEFYAGFGTDHLSEDAPARATRVLSSQNEKILVLDEYPHSLGQSEQHNPLDSLHRYLKSNSIAVSVRLTTNNELVGYLLLGPKLSGNLYSQQDKDLLSIAANEMAVAIQNARRFDEIKRFNETLKLEIDRATGELRQSNEKLQALDEAKDEFISMASHQLRTPLTSVKGYLSMVLEGDAGKVDKKQQELLSAAFTSSQRMVYLIADLLNVSRLQTGKFVIEPTVSNLPLVVESEIDQIKETARAKNIKINFKKPKSFPEVYIDETKTRQVIMNFIDNAIYYTPQDGKIDVSLHANKSSIEYRVKDNGIGVPKEEQKNMFSKFYRATNAKKARPDGTGLGLFMAKKVIIDQGGAIIFESKEGEGSTFGFTFPLTRVRPPKNTNTTESAKKSRKSSRKKSK